jgi:hypothetical protein
MLQKPLVCARCKTATYLFQGLRTAHRKRGGRANDFYLFLQKQQPAHRYIPIGYVPPGIKESTCDDATIMSLMVL